MEYKVWSGEYGVWSVECEVGKCKVWNVWNVWNVKCGVESVECKV